MQDFEKLGLFYLGREYDVRPASGSRTPVLYDSRDLVTHAVCVGDDRKRKNRVVPFAH